MNMNADDIHKASLLACTLDEIVRDELLVAVERGKADGLSPPVVASALLAVLLTRAAELGVQMFTIDKFLMAAAGTYNKVMKEAQDEDRAA